MKRAIGITVAVLLVAGLLALFVVPSHLVTVRIDLPPIGPAKPPPRAEPVWIVMQLDGRITVDGAVTTLDTLTRDVAARFAGTPKDEQRVMIRATGDISYDRFMAVLNRLQDHGWYKVGLVNEEITTSAEPKSSRDRQEH